MPVRLTILGSGSSGNCAYLETAETRILIDAGFSLRQIRQRLAAISRVPENLTGILITHEHADHVQGLVALSEKLRIPVYTNRPTLEAIQYQLKTKLESRLFTTGATFELGDLMVETFMIPHDAQDPVGFLVRTAEGNIGFLTDLGHATKLVLERVRHANVLVLESNHDIKLLQDCPRRPWSLKQRILGRHGHLSNEAAAEAAEQIMSADLHHLYLGHLSRECNRPDLAHRVMRQRLEKLGATHVRLELTSQHQLCPTLELVGMKSQKPTVVDQESSAQSEPAELPNQRPGTHAPPAGGTKPAIEQVAKGTTYDIRTTGDAESRLEDREQQPRRRPPMRPGAAARNGKRAPRSQAPRNEAPEQIQLFDNL